MVEFARRVLPSNVVVEKVKYFTARASGAHDPDTPRRQNSYLRALNTCPEVEIFYGNFLAKTVWRPIANLPVAGAAIATTPSFSAPKGTYSVSGGTLRNPAQLVIGEYSQRGASRDRSKSPKPLHDALIAEVHTMEEKGSDVNLAVHLLNDAWRDVYEGAVVISNDTDLVEPIKMIVNERGKPVTCISPREGKVATQLAAAATSTRHFRKSMLAASQLPNPCHGIAKPPSW